MVKSYQEILSKYLPDGSVDTILEWLDQYKFHLRISRSRTSKLGDYRPPTYRPYHQISVNHNLNPYAFLITLVHEVAHMLVWEKHKNGVRPHGKEWKQMFQKLLLPFIHQKLFPEDLEKALTGYLANTKASSVSDLELTRILKRYDQHPSTVLEDLPTGAIFSIYNGRTFKKLEKQRKRYRCLCLENKKTYLVNPLAEVEPITRF